MESTMDPDKRSAWLRKLDAECPYQVALPRRQLSDDREIMDFLMSRVGTFDMYVEDEYAAFVRYCFESPDDAAIFRSRLSRKGALQARGLRAKRLLEIAVQRSGCRVRCVPASYFVVGSV
jgi:hypothetical protein